MLVFWPCTRINGYIVYGEKCNIKLAQQHCLGKLRYFLIAGNGYVYEQVYISLLQSSLFSF